MFVPIASVHVDVFVPISSVHVDVFVPIASVHVDVFVPISSVHVDVIIISDAKSTCRFPGEFEASENEGYFVRRNDHVCQFP